MSSEWVRAGVMAGAVGAAATTGAVLALAWRAGAALRPFSATGRAVLGGGGELTAALVGFALHVAVAVVWGLVLAAIAYRARSALVLLTAAAVSLLALVVHSGLLPALRLGYGLGVFPLQGAPLYYLYGLFGLALAAGMRLAR